MSLDIQIYSLLFSFVFGIIFSIELTYSKKLIYHKNIILKIVSSLIIVIINAFIYFIIINKINNGILHPYMFKVLILGFYFIDIVKKR